MIPARYQSRRSEFIREAGRRTILRGWESRTAVLCFANEFAPTEKQSAIAMETTNAS